MGDKNTLTFLFSVLSRKGMEMVFSSKLHISYVAKTGSGGGGVIVTGKEGSFPMLRVWMYFSHMPKCIVTTKLNRLVLIKIIT